MWMCHKSLAIHNRRYVLSGRYTVRCNIAEFVIRGSSYKDSEPWALHAQTHATCHSVTPDKSRNNFLHAQTMASAILFESRTIILATVQCNWQCISWLYIGSTKEFHVTGYTNVSNNMGAFRCIHARNPSSPSWLNEVKVDLNGHCSLIG